jgi:hypothetical protein
MYTQIKVWTCQEWIKLTHGRDNGWLLWTVRAQLLKDELCTIGLLVTNNSPWCSKDHKRHFLRYVEDYNMHNTASCRLSRCPMWHDASVTISKTLSNYRNTPRLEAFKMPHVTRCKCDHLQNSEQLHKYSAFRRGLFPTGACDLWLLSLTKSPFHT